MNTHVTLTENVSISMVGSSVDVTAATSEMEWRTAQVALCLNTHCHIIGASRSEPHINHAYEKITVLMYMAIHPGKSVLKRV